MTTKLYTQRHRPRATSLTSEISPKARNRVWYAIKAFFRSSFDRDFNELLLQTQEELLQLYGGLAGSLDVGVEANGEPDEAPPSHWRQMYAHILHCSHEQFLDFVEAVFRSGPFWKRAVNRLPDPLQDDESENDLWFQTLIHKVNEIFQEEGIRYEFTEQRGAIPYVAYSEAIPKGSEFQHQKVVKPALDLLSDRRFRVANDEMLDAHRKLRRGDLDDAVTSCCSAFESVLKTVCDLKGWTYDPDKDTLRALVKICKDHGLFPKFYVNTFEAAGTVRNKLGDAHGRGPQRLYSVDKANVEHLLQVTSSHILLVVKLAKL